MRIYYPPGIMMYSTIPVKVPHEYWAALMVRQTSTYAAKYSTPLWPFLLWYYYNALI